MREVDDVDEVDFVDGMDGVDMMDTDSFEVGNIPIWDNLYVCGVDEVDFVDEVDMMDRRHGRTRSDTDWEGVRMYCEGCGCVREFINCRVEGLDEVYTCSVCFMDKWFRVR